MRAGPRAPRFVVISMTPLAPFLPQIAVAEASLSTLMSRMSSVFTFSNSANFSSVAVATSKSERSRSVAMSPFTTISGSLLVRVETVLTPRKRICEPAPTLPEEAMISRPAIRPCRASSTEVIPRPSNSFASKPWAA